MLSCTFTDGWFENTITSKVNEKSGEKRRKKEVEDAIFEK